MKTKLTKQLLEICSKEELFKVMKCTPLKKGFLRLNAIYSLMHDIPKAKVMEMNQISRKTLYLWIRRFFKCGVDGLINKPRYGRPKLLKEGEVKNKLIEILDEPNKDNLGLYTAVKIHAYLKEQYKVEFSYSSCLRYIHKEGYNRRIPRRMPANGDKELQNAFKKRLEELSKDESNEIWFAHESGFDGDPRPDAKYTKRRSKSKKIILVVENASWHKTKSLNWHHIQVVYLPPYSPDLNPIERLCLRIKADFFANFTAKTPEELTNRIIEALTYYLKHGKKLFHYLNLGNYF
ncbi:MAG: transposase [Candidatus Pacearchaeota archaeon]